MILKAILILEVLKFKKKKGLEDYISSEVNPLYNKPAITAPTIGAKMNTQTCCKACPPKNNAGAKLRAGFTEVPVNGIPMMCTNASVKPITIPATAPFSTFLVTPRTVNTNTKVKIISTSIAPTTSKPTLDADPNPFWPSPVAMYPPRLGAELMMTAKRAIPIIAPIHWNTMYISKSFVSNLPSIHIPIETAGLM